MPAFRATVRTAGADIYIVSASDSYERLVGHGDLGFFRERQQLFDAAARVGLFLQLGGQVFDVALDVRVRPPLDASG